MNKFLTIFALSFSLQIGFAQLERRVVSTGVPFLLITSDARAAGMGDMGVATQSDAFSQQWNPSKYAFAERQMGVGVSYTPYLSKLVNDIFLANIAYYNRTSERAAWGASLKYFSLGEIEFLQNPQDVPVVESPNELTLDLSYSLKLSDQFAMSVAGRYIRSDLKLTQVDPDAEAASSFAVDFAGFYRSEEMAYNNFNGRWRAGFNISNLGPKLKYDQQGKESYLPTNLRVGGGFDFIFDFYNRLSVNLEFNKLLVPSPSEPIIETKDGEDIIVGYRQPDVSFLSGIGKSFGDAPGGFSEEMQEVTWALGLEYWYDNAFALRAGYFNEHENKGARKFFTLGAGFKYSAVNVDLSYLFSASKIVSPLENTLRFSVTFNLGEDYQEL